MGAEKNIVVPDIGDFSDVEIIEILVSEGDSVEQEDSLITLETDKASMEIPSSDNGTISKMLVKMGDKVNIGDTICVMNVASDDVETTEDHAPVEPEVEVSPEVVPAPVAERAIGEPAVTAPPVAESTELSTVSSSAHASPSVRRYARELGVILDKVSGSGRKGRITKEDVTQFVKQQLSGAAGGATTSGLSLPSQPDIDFSKFGEVDIQPLGRIKKISGAHLHKSWLTLPHVTQFDEADITELEAFRKQQKEIAIKQDIRLTFMPFLMKACAKALLDMPEMNSSLAADGENLIYKKYVNIGVAVDTPNGLVVPVIKDVDKKSVFELAKELMEISEKSRNGKLGPADMQGGCFTISSLGGIGGTQFTPIVNSPEVAILGVSRSAMKPVWDGKEFAPRMILPLALSYDHRVIDGAQGVRFTTRLSELLTDIRCLLL